ncbi:hypothetical protein Tco_1282179, partial [Tanacetum coccineum]
DRAAQTQLVCKTIGTPYACYGFEQLEIHLSNLYHSKLSRAVDAFNRISPRSSMQTIMTFGLKMFHNLGSIKLQFKREIFMSSMQRLVLEVLAAASSKNILTHQRVMNPDKQDTSSSLENYTTHDVDANIRPVNDEEPFAEVQLTAHTIMLASEQQHTEQSEPSYDTYLVGNYLKQ